MSQQDSKAVFDAAKAGDQFCIFITEKVANHIVLGGECLQQD